MVLCGFHGPVTPVTTDDESDGAFTTVKRREKRRSEAPVTTPVVKRLPQKALAELVKVPGGSSYTDTVKSVKKAVNPTELGVLISPIRKTRDGHLIL